MTSRCLVLFAIAIVPAIAGPITGFSQTNLVSSVQGQALTTDTTMQNPWGLAFSPTSPFWVADNVTNQSTLYNGAGAKQGLIVNVPGNPTGVVFNSTAGFTGDLFIFATLSGDIYGCRNALGTNAERLFLNTNTVLPFLASGAIGASCYLSA